MTPNEHLEKLRKDYLKDIDLFFKDNNLTRIELHPVTNNLGIEPTSLTKKGILTLIDDYGNDNDEIIHDLSIEIIGHILTLILTGAYDNA